MKKLILILMVVSAFFVSCSNDSEDNTPPQKEVYMRILSIGSQPKDGEVLYVINYGTSDADQVIVFVSKEVWDFYQTRYKAGNYRWIGEVTKEK